MPKFNIGDRVVVTRSEYHGGSGTLFAFDGIVPVGSVGTVSAGPDETGDFLVDFPRDSLAGAVGDWWISADGLDHETSAPEGDSESDSGWTPPVAYLARLTASACAAQILREGHPLGAVCASEIVALAAFLLGEETSA